METGRGVVSSAAYSATLRCTLPPLSSTAALAMFVHRRLILCQSMLLVMYRLSRGEPQISAPPSPSKPFSARQQCTAALGGVRLQPTKARLSPRRFRDKPWP